MFDFDVVTGPSDLAKLARSEARRPSPGNPPATAPTPSSPGDQVSSDAGGRAAAGSVSGIVGGDTRGYSDRRPA